MSRIDIVCGRGGEGGSEAKRKLSRKIEEISLANESMHKNLD